MAVLLVYTDSVLIVLKHNIIVGLIDTKVGDKFSISITSARFAAIILGKAIHDTQKRKRYANFMAG